MVELGFPVSPEEIAEEEGISVEQIEKTLLFKDPNSVNWDGGVVGGRPIWLVPLRKEEQVLFKCSQCEKQLSFLMEIYAPRDEQEAAFHRAIYLFACAGDHPPEVRVFRQQLPEKNSVYSDELTHEESRLSLGKELCNQVFIAIEAEDKGEEEGGTKTELAPSSLFDKRFDQDINIDQKELNEITKLLCPTAKLSIDDTFRAFSEAICEAPDQIIRYSERALWLKEELPLLPKTCKNCHKSLNLEFQVMPQILNLFEADTFSFDSLFVFSCSDSCTFNGNLYEEEVVSQNFSH